jgi:hypothetical protein
MRDIRNDLKERANLIDEQIKVAYAHFENAIQQLKTEREAKIADLQSGIAMIAKFMEFEERFLANVSPPAAPSPLLALADLFMRRLNETGQLSKKELVDLAAKEGFFPDAEHASQGVHPMLVNMLRSELIRELSDGTLAPPTLSQTIKLRRVV